MKTRIRSNGNRKIKITKYRSLSFLLALLCILPSPPALAESESSSQRTEPLSTGSTISEISTEYRDRGRSNEGVFPQNTSSLKSLSPIIEPPSMPLGERLITPETEPKIDPPSLPGLPLNQEPIDPALLKEPPSLNTGEPIVVDSGVNIPEDFQPPVPVENDSSKQGSGASAGVQEKPSFPGLGGITIAAFPVEKKESTPAEQASGPSVTTGNLKDLDLSGIPPIVSPETEPKIDPPKLNPTPLKEKPIDPASLKDPNESFTKTREDIAADMRIKMPENLQPPVPVKNNSYTREFGGNAAVSLTVAAAEPESPEPTPPSEGSSRVPVPHPHVVIPTPVGWSTATAHIEATSERHSTDRDRHNRRNPSREKKHRK